MSHQLYAKQPPSLIWRRRVIALGAFGAILGAIVVIIATTLGGGGGSASAGRSIDSFRGHPVTVAASQYLAQAVERAAGVPSGAVRTMLVLGGRSGQGAAVNSIQELASVTGRVVGHLPNPTAGGGAVNLAGTVYLFGGEAGSVSGRILAVKGARAHPVGRLQRGVTNAAVTGLGGTAFVIGGSDGTSELDGVVAWKPGGPAHQTAHLPIGLEFAAAAGSGDVVIIAGGVSRGKASRSIFRFDPAKHTVERIGQLPIPLGHAAAAAVDGLVFVLGGRTDGPGSQTRAIYAIDPVNGSTRFAGALPAGLSDAAAAVVEGGILVAGGTNRAGKVQSSVLAVTLPPLT
ncbi:MAG: hypothetical protein LC713_02955 [Actinobacteria bacterium]|nr:hypothetical protein [Actinomycetota bacterium]